MIEVHKGTGQRYRSTVRRPDGVIVGLEGGSYNRVGGPVGRVPHDIAHLIVEDHLRLDRGLWGVLAAGGLVQNATFVSGRLPPHARRRAAAISAAAGEDLRQAEVLVRMSADVAVRGRPGDLDALKTAIGARWWTPHATAASLTAIVDGLRAAAQRWDDLSAGDAFALQWPARTSAGRVRSGRGRTGRHGAGGDIDRPPGRAS
jgi:hypothetical protein